MPQHPHSLSRSFLAVGRGLPVSHLSMAKCCGFREPTRLDVAHRWLTKEAFVFAVELTRAFISNFKGCTRSIEPLDQHPFSRCYQAKLFLILKRAHGRQRTEMMMQG